MHHPSDVNRKHMKDTENWIGLKLCSHFNFVKTVSISDSIVDCKDIIVVVPEGSVKSAILYDIEKIPAT